MVGQPPSSESKLHHQKEENPVMVLLASTYDQSKYLRAEDVTQPKVLRIKKVTEELVGSGANQEKKLVVSFSNGPKGLPLNRTNNRTIRGAYGDDTTNWSGKSIVVFQAEVEFKGKLVAGLRVRIPPPKQPSNLVERLAEKTRRAAMAARGTRFGRGAAVARGSASARARARGGRAAAVRAAADVLPW
jgi:hypothetical protein